MAEKVFESIAVKQIDVGSVQLQAGKVGRPAYFHAETDVKLGGWFNASKSYMDFGSDGTGEITGMASAHNSEILLPNKSMAGGAYTAGEFNLNMQTNTDFHNNPAYPVSIASFRVGGVSGAVDKWEADGSACVFNFSGFTAANDELLDTQGGATQTHALRCIIDGTPVWLMLASDPGA